MTHTCHATPLEGSSRGGRCVSASSWRAHAAAAADCRGLRRGAAAAAASPSTCATERDRDPAAVTEKDRDPAVTAAAAAAAVGAASGDGAGDALAVGDDAVNIVRAAASSARESGPHAAAARSHDAPPAVCMAPMRMAALPAACTRPPTLGLIVFAAT